MTPEEISAINAINNFMFLGWNYESTIIERIAYNGLKELDSVPRFIAEIQWPCSRSHIATKFRSAYDKAGSRNSMFEFYGELDNYCRRLLIEWMLKNYSGNELIKSN